jgi:hypothetical protein
MMPFPDNFDANRGVLYVEGTAFLNGSGAVDNTQNIGRQFTLTRTGVGTANLKILVPAKALLNCSVILSKAAILNRLLHVLGRTQGTDGMWTVALALTDLNNAGVVAAEFAAANAAAFISFAAQLQLGSP